MDGSLAWHSQPPTVRRKVLVSAAAVLILLSIDLSRAPFDQFSTRAAIGGIHLYQATWSRVYARMGLRCRFMPTCSEYGEICIRRFGALRGGWMAMKRVVRCGPWTPAGTLDPPPL